MVFYHDFSLTLTTLALYQRSLRWFEVCSYKPTSRGLPSSLAQLRTLPYLESALVAHYIAVNNYWQIINSPEKDSGAADINIICHTACSLKTEYCMLLDPFHYRRLPGAVEDTLLPQ